MEHRPFSVRVHLTKNLRSKNAELPYAPPVRGPYCQPSEKAGLSCPDFILLAQIHLNLALLLFLLIPYKLTYHLCIYTYGIYATPLSSEVITPVRSLLKVWETREYP